MKKNKATLKLLLLFIVLTAFFSIILYLSPATIATN